jgi:hypothetical protein
MSQLAPTQSNVQAALASFITAVLPGTLGASPAVFTGTITGTTLTVTKMLTGQIALNAPLLGAAPGTTVAAVGTGSGGVGTYRVSVSQTVGNQATFATGVTVIAGQQNRAPEPVNPWFVVMTPIRFNRLATNIDSSDDVKFTGSIAGNTLTVSALISGAIVAGATVFGTGVAANTVVTAIGSPGVYTVSPNQNAASAVMSAGSKALMQEAESTVQLDFHSPDSTSGDFAQAISTALRDEYGVNFFAGLAAPLNGVVPFYADDPAQRPFINAENQYETRWVLEACFQVNQTLSVPQEYADAATITLKDVDALYPP